MAAKTDERQRWGIILAGGDGTRLRPLTRRISGDDVPKQFCRVLGTETMLEQTMRRVALSIDSDKLISLVTRAHEPFYAPLLAGVPSSRIVAQPRNRGTAPAILYALLRVARYAPDACVALFPSDHYADDAAEFMRHVDSAFRTIRERPEVAVLLGIAPENDEIGYGWIEPALPLSGRSPEVFRVSRFWEKPGIALARELRERGCLWNSFVMVARLSTMLGMIALALPKLYLAFRSLTATFDTLREVPAIESLYDRLDSINFSEQVLERHTGNLTVLPVRGVAWSDLGEPRRVMDVIARTGVRPRWAAA